MAVHGNTGTGGGGTQSIEQIIRCFEFTPVNGESNPVVTARLTDNALGAHTVKAVLFRASDGVFIAESATRNDINTGVAAYDFSITATLSAIAYRIGLYAGSGGGVLTIESDNTAGTMYSQSAGTFPTVPDPATLTSGTATLRMYATTTDPAGGSAKARKLGLLGVA